MIKKEMKEDSCSLHQALLKPEIFRNLVWTAADIADFRRAVLPLAQAAAKSGRRVIYIHYSGCEVLFEEKSFPEGGFSMQEVPLSHRFEVFTVAVYSLIAEGGEDAVYLFDPLSMLQAAWTTDLMMENFITVMTCLVKKKGVSAHYPLLRDRLFLLPYLLDLLSDESGGIRLGVQDCAGRYIAMDCGQDPNIWPRSLRKILFDGKGSAPAQRIRAGNALAGLLHTVYENAPEENKKAILSGYGSYFKSTKWDRISCESLLKGIFDIPYNVWGTMQRGNILGFVRYFIKNDTKDVRLASLVLLARWKREGWKPARDFSEYMKNVLEATVRETEGKKGASAVRRLAFEIARGLTEIFPEYSEKAASPGGPFDDAVLFRENLDSNVSDLVKYINLRILREKYEEAEGNDPGFSGYYAHLLIFMRLNSEVVLFRRAGENLLAFLDRLAEHQKQEIMAELLNCVGEHTAS